MSAVCQNTTLNSPLNNALLLEALETFRQNKKPRNGRVAAIVHDIRALDEFVEIPVDSSNFSQNLNSTYNQVGPELIPPHVTQNWKTIFTKASVLYSAKASVLIGTRFPFSSIKNKADEILSHDDFGSLLSCYYWKWILEKLVIASSRPKHVTKKRGPECNPHLKYLNPESKNPLFSYRLSKNVNLVVSSSFLYISDKAAEQTWMVSREHLLQLSDTANQRHSVLMTAIMADLLHDNTVPKPTLLRWIFDWGDDIIDIYGNKGYKSVKMWEPIMTAYLLNFYPDPHVDQNIFWNMIAYEFINSQGDENYDDMERRLLELNDRLTPFQHDNPHILSQLFGLYRIWGHPTVDGLDGISKLKQLVRHQHMIDKNSVRVIVRKWREYFCTSYYNKERRWPIFDESTYERDNFLTQVLRENRPLDKMHPDYNDADWDFVVLGKTFDVPERFELSEMISDKATSLDIPELRNRCTNYHDIGPSKDRSVIIRWLRSDDQNPREFLEDIGTNGFKPETRVAGVYPKERETKNAPRLFGLMTLQRRLYIVITEALISDFILKYFPEITMTYDQSSLFTRLHQVTKPLGEEKTSEATTIVTNIDFEKWNSHMREEETIDIFTDFDRLFGLNQVFSRSHELFNECTFYLADGTITPEWQGDQMKEGLGVWTGHLGGIEGLRQKGWTVLTVVILKYICEWRQIKYQLLGQGDNQVLLTHYYPKSGITISQQHTNFIHDLDRFLQTIGPPLKLEESWSSSHFFTYGKFPLLKGVPLSMSLKRISRCGHLNNEGIASLDSVLSAISASASSAVLMSQNPLTPLLTASFETISALMQYLGDPFYGEDLTYNIKRLKIRVPSGDGNQLTVTEPVIPRLKSLMRRLDSLALALAMIPSALGGYPIFQAADIIMHGFPDPVALALWECKTMYHNLPPEHSSLRSILICALNPRISGIRNPELLCQSPTSLNILRGSRPKDQIKRLVLEHLPKIEGIRNQAFQFFFEESLKDQKPLAEALFSMEPLHPRVMASIYESTPTGVAQAITRKLQSTRTLETIMISAKDEEARRWEEMVTEGGEVRVYNRPRGISDLTYLYERNQFHSILLILNQPNPSADVVETCSTRLAEDLRFESWGKRLKGVTVAVPMETLHRENSVSCRDDNHPNPDLGYIRCQTSIGKYENPRKAFTSVGPFKPFFGSKTEEHVKYEGGRLVKMSPPIMKMSLKNLRIINWGTEETSNLSLLIQSIFGHVTDLDWKQLIPQPGNVTGTLEHRWADTRTEHSVAPAISFITSTHFTVNTNKFTPELADHVRNHDNVNVNHQAMFSYIAFENMMSCIYDVFIPATTHWHVKCTSCIQEVDETLIEIPASESLDAVLDSYAAPHPSPYAWIPAERFDPVVGGVQQYPSLSGIQYLGDWNQLLPAFVVNWYLTARPISMGGSAGWELEEDPLIIPIAVVIKLHAPVILPLLAKMMILSAIYQRIMYWFGHSSIKDVSHMIQAEISRLLNLPIGWYLPLTSLFLSSSVANLLEEQLPHLSPPKNCPPTLNEKAACIRSIIHELWYRDCHVESLSRAIVGLSRGGLPRSSVMIFHPEVLWCLEALLRDGNNRSVWCQTLSIIRETQLNQGYEDRINTVSYFDQLEDKGIYRRAAELRERRPKVIIVDSSPEFVAKQCNVRIHPGGVNLMTDQQVTIPMSRLKTLPMATHNVTYKPDFEGEEIALLRHGLKHVTSAINNLHKDPVIITSAPYKLLSIMVFLERSGVFRRINPRAIACCGDGTGGFGALCAQLFPRARIIYNSQYQIENQSSIGCDKFVPAAMISKRIRSDQLVGLEEVIEGVSDLTDPLVIGRLGRECDKIDILTCDAEGGSKENIRKLITITKILLTFSLIKGIEVLIIKSYLSRLDLVIAQCHILSTCFKRVDVVRSHFSNHGNTEIYIVGQIRRTNVVSSDTDYDLKTDQVTLQVPAPSSSSIREFKSRISQFDLKVSCRSVGGPYSEVLRLPNQSHQGSHSWRIHLQKLMDIKDRRFPQDLVQVLKDEFLLVKFNPVSRTVLRKHLLTNFVAKQLLKYYVAWILMEKSEKEMMRLENTKDDIFFCIYETITRKWSMTFSLNPAKGRKYKSWKISELVDQVFWKEVYSCIRDTRLFTQNDPITWQWCGSETYPYVVKQVTDFKDWKARVGSECAPMSQLPHPAKDQKLVITAGFSMSQSENHQQEDTITVLRRLRDEGLLTGDIQSVDLFLKRSKELSSSHVHTSGMYRYLKSAYDFDLTR